MSANLHVIILAAGQGTRMKSDLPKVLHTLGHISLLEHVINAANELDAQSIHVVYGHGGTQVKQRLSHIKCNWVEQAEQNGTGHAVQQAIPAIPNNETTLILYGDVPLIKSSTLKQLVENVDESCMSLLTAELSNPTGYGRIIRDDKGKVKSIVEEKDASTNEKKVKEINTGMLAVNSDLLSRWLSELKNDNAQGEYYLTDIIAMAANESIEINTVSPEKLFEIEGINNKAQLAELERVHQKQQAHEIMMQGVTIKDPARFDLRGTLTAGRDVVIDVNVVIEGNVKLGDGVTIEANNVIINSTMGNNVTIHPNCVVDNAQLANECEIGPFARLRPDTELHNKSKVGNFVEIKKSIVAEGSKINHLSYIGDTTMGKNVNVGAGTITCNYDGANKHRTIIGDNVFIGSDTQLVAPVEVGEGATIGAGSTVTHDAPAGDLTLSRAIQKTRKGWKRPKKHQ